MDVLTPEIPAANLPTSTEKPERIPPDRKGRVADDLLVAVDGKESGWNVLDQAFDLAHRENARVLGLHVVATDADSSNEELKALEAQFEQRCRNADIAGRLAMEVGKTAKTICERARWADRVITGLAPAAPRGLRTRLRSEFRILMRRCPRPVLVVPGACRAPQRALLAYDGSPKSDEALYVATYLAGWWSLSLAIVTVNESVPRASKIQEPARSYIEYHGIEAKMVLVKGPAAQTILHEADAHSSDIILMGGYGSSPPVEAMLGSAVDEVLQMSKRPVFVLT